ncbi:MAG TPA: SMC family ATPase [Roseiflexaceae bacterium]|nr:SMC family ATPase [Roseiflexaceae bacterium]
MIPRKIALRNFMCYREGLPPLDLDGITIACLAGENGAGKSALLDAMTWALWGEARLGADELIALGALEMEVELVFSLDGHDYRVIRKRSRGKRVGQTWLEFQARNGEGWKAIGEAGVRETQEAITRTLRMDYELFANSAYLRQGHADEFTRKEPGRRKEVLASILGLQVYEDLEARARERARKLEGETRGLEGQITTLRQRAEKREVYLEELRRAELLVAELEARIAAAHQERERAAARAQALEGRRALRDERLRQTDRARAECEQLRADVEKRRGHVARALEMIERRAEILEGVARLTAALAERARLEALRDEYDALQERRAALGQELRAEEARLRADLMVAESELRGLRERAARKPALLGQIEELRRQLEGLGPLAEELAQARTRRADLRERIRVVNELMRQRTAIEGKITLRRDSLVATREDLKRQIKKLAEEVRDEARWREELAQAQKERQRLAEEALRLEERRRLERDLAARAASLEAEIKTIEARGREIRQKIDMLKGDLRTCPLCGSDLADSSHIEAEYERERGELLARRTECKREQETVAAQVSALRAEIEALARRTAAAAEVAAQIARMEGALRAAEERRREQAERQRQLDDVQMQLLRGEYERGLRQELSQVESQIAGLGALETLEREMNALEMRVAQLEQRAADQSALQARLVGVQEELARIEAEDPAAHEQEQAASALATRLATGDYAHAARAELARLEAQVAALGYSRERYDAARAEVEALQSWEEQGRRLARAEEWLAENRDPLARDEEALRRREDELAAAEAELRALDEELRALAPALRERDEAAAELGRLQAEMRVRQKDLGERQANLRGSEEAAEELLRVEEQRRATAERKGLFDELAQAFGKKGVQAMLIETAIPEIEREANSLLARMTDNQMHLTFETQGATKKGDTVETLEIKIADALGTRVYDAYSGGEAFRLDFAIRIALAKLLARRAGARLETLVIDEGFGSQDTRGRERLVEAITSVQGEFKRILVITHIQELKDLFPVQIEITKTPQGSVWALA